MKHSKPHRAAIRLDGSRKTDVRTQFGALCWRIRNDKMQVALVTSRRTKRWIIPKGWPVDGATPTQSAATEAWEEAGIEGKVENVCIGFFAYAKNSGNQTFPCIVAVFPLKAARARDAWPEARERRRKWVSSKKAAKMVDNAQLARLIRDFDPRGLVA